MKRPKPPRETEAKRAEIEAENDHLRAEIAA